MAGFELDRSAKENKSLAVSAELDEMGMGRYQVSTEANKRGGDVVHAVRARSLPCLRH